MSYLDQRKELVPTSEVFYILVTTIFTHKAVKVIPVQKNGQLGENVFVLEHLQYYYNCKDTSSSPLALFSLTTG